MIAATNDVFIGLFGGDWLLEGEIDFWREGEKCLIRGVCLGEFSRWGDGQIFGWWGGTDSRESPVYSMWISTMSYTFSYKVFGNIFYRQKPKNIHSVKSVQRRSNIWSAFSRIRTEYGPEITSYLDTFHAAII